MKKDGQTEKNDETNNVSLVSDPQEREIIISMQR
jgi:hypothetical protein